VSKGKKGRQVIRAAPVPGLLKVGILKFVDSEKRFAFIQQEDDGEENLYVHHKDVADGNELIEGDRVTYEEVYDDRKGKRKRKAVKVTSHPGTKAGEAEFVEGTVIKEKTGYVKWFNNKRGFGLIVADDNDETIFAHKSDIVHRHYLIGGERVQYDETHHVRKGKQRRSATTIIGIGDSSSGDAGAGEGVGVGSKTGFVKYFNSKKGFGFIQPEDDGADVFAHQNDIVDGLQATRGFALTEGETVRYDEVYNFHKGKSFAMNITRDSSIGGDAACFSEVQYDSDQPKTGTVKYFFEDYGGCIEQDDGGDDLFTYLYEVVDNQVLNVGDAVRYFVGYDPQGEICAMNITRCAEEDEGLDGGDKVASGCAGASVGERQGSGTERVKKVV